MIWYNDIEKKRKNTRCGACNFLEWLFITIKLSKKSKKYGNKIRFVVNGGE